MSSAAHSTHESDVPPAPPSHDPVPPIARASAPRFGSVRAAFRPQRAGVAYALVLLVVALMIATAVRGQPAYLSVTNASNIVGQAAPYGILAIFMTVVLISGNFDLSVGSVAALAGAVALLTIDDVGTVGAVALALGAGLVAGTINAVLVQVIGVNAFIVTLGSLTAIRGVVLILLNGESVTAQSQALASFDAHTVAVPAALCVVVGGAVLAGAAARFRAALRAADSVPLDGFFVASVAVGAGAIVLAIFAPGALTQPLPVWLMLALSLVVSLVLRFLTVGRNLHAVGSSPEAARLSGINVNRYKMVPFVLSGVAAAGVGVIFAGQFNSLDPNALSGTELTVIAAAILGGTSLFGGAGYVAKSVLGTIVLFTLSNGFNVLNLGSNYQYVVQGVVLVAASAIYTVASRGGTTRARAEPETANAGADAASDVPGRP
ncbi:MAG: ribose transport system permease protein [Baekduia sp.]|nr:ribose transport system permease protein [Baekduia sp.]